MFSVLVSCSVNDITTMNENDTTTTTEKVGINLPSNPTDADYLQYICEVYGSYFNSEKNFNHKNLISRSVQKSIDKNIPETKKVTLNNVEYELQYESTHYNPFFDRSLNFFTNEEGNVKVLLTKNGEIAEIKHKFATINIGDRATPEEVLPKLKETLEEFTDMTKYKNVKMPTYHSENEDGFGLYDFMFYSSVDGYVTDYITVSVKDSGEIFVLRIHNWNQNFTSLNINKNLETKMLELKFKDIYTTSTTEYISYELDERFIPQVIIREGTVYVCYTGSAKYLVKSTGAERNSYVTEILIPIEFISSES